MHPTLTKYVRERFPHAETILEALMAGLALPVSKLVVTYHREGTQFPLCGYPERVEFNWPVDDIGTQIYCENQWLTTRRDGMCWTHHRKLVSMEQAVATCVAEYRFARDVSNRYTVVRGGTRVRGTHPGRA